MKRTTPRPEPVTTPDIKTPTIKQRDENPIPHQILADHIVRISNGFKDAKSGRLKERVLYLLIRDITGISLGDIQAVLDACSILADKYVKSENKR